MATPKFSGGRAKATAKFKIVIGAGNWGGPLAHQAAFKTLDEAIAAARGYLERQRQVAGPGTVLRATIEETTPDGSVLTHSVD
jgi:hypothetical protein